jgi:hypothetical protein
MAEKAYSCYEFEDALQKKSGITLVPRRKSNQKHSNAEELETVFSSITSRMPRYIKAKTENGFCLKILFSILAYMELVLRHVNLHLNH